MTNSLSTNAIIDFMQARANDILKNDSRTQLQIAELVINLVDDDDIFIYTEDKTGIYINLDKLAHVNKKVLHDIYDILNTRLSTLNKTTQYGTIFVHDE